MKSLLSLFLAFSVQAVAQDYRQGMDLGRYSPPPRTEGKISSALEDPYYIKMSTKLAADLDQKYQSLLAVSGSADTTCQVSSETLKAVRAMRLRGELDRCMNVARNCRDKVGGEAQLVLLEGAACGHQVLKFREAHELFDLATDSAHASSPYQDLAAYRFALFARNTQYEGEVPGILARYSKWNSQDLKEILAILVLINNGHVEGFTEAQVQQKIDSLSAKNSEWANEMTIAWLTHLIVNKDDSVGALHFLEKNFSNVYEVDRMYKYIFMTFYYSEGENFKFAKPSLEVYYKYAGPYSWFPVEQNIYVVSELFSKICPVSLTQGRAADELKSLKTSWLNGAKPEDILRQVQLLDVKAPLKADILTLKGSLLTSLRREDEAMDAYWKAHELCPYYHRGHWGLWGNKKDRLYRAMDDYSMIRQRVTREVSEGIFPASIEKYVMNWAMLTPEQVEGVKHAVRIWGPFMDGLVAANTRLYIKYDFEYHSEIPGYESDRDERAWPPDNRSLDELRGRGGNPVVSDIGETMRSPHGDYNLAAHEIAHSWHLDYLPSVGRTDLQNCITKLYKGCAQRGNFPDSYAASHENEYFAQSIGYYLIPVGAPARYGLTVEWMMKYDMDMYEFIQRIRASGGDISKVKCPL